MLKRVQPGDAVSAAVFNAVVDAVNGVLKLSGSYPVEVRRHGGGMHVSLAYTEREALVELTEDLEPGGSAAAKTLWHDGTTWIDGATASITVHDPLKCCAGRPGDRMFCRFHRQSGLWIAWSPPRLKRGTLDGPLSYGGSATCSLLTGAPGSETDSGTDQLVYDGLLTAGDTAIPAGATVFIALVNGYWWVIAVSCPT